MGVWRTRPLAVSAAVCAFVAVVCLTSSAAFAAFSCAATGTRSCKLCNCQRGALQGCLILIAFDRGRTSWEKQRCNLICKKIYF